MESIQDGHVQNHTSHLANNEDAEMLGHEVQKQNGHFSNDNDTEKMVHDGKDISFNPHYMDDGDLNRTMDEGSLGIEKQPIDLSWRNLTFGYDLPSAKKLPCFPGGKEKDGETGEEKPKRKMILHNCSGAVHTGQMLAIMGSSGAGKTTLLNLLAGRITSASKFTSSGQVLVNGRKRNFKSFKKISAYVMQNDDMFAELTVQEQIRFSSLLRLPSTMPQEKKLQRVDKVVQELGLSKVRDSVVGNEIIRGISGGEVKRTSLGVELVTDPSLIFLDEPTTGLDAFNALNVMATLRKLAYNGRTVITTIHQPRSNIFSMFDYLLLLSEGRTMYFGPAADARTYFAGLNYQSPPQFNPADFFIDLLSVDPRSKEQEEKTRARIMYLADRFKSSEEPKMLAHDDRDIEKVEEADSNGGSQLKSDLRDNKFQSNWFKEFVVLCRRSSKLILRERAATGARAVQTIIFSILLGLIWLSSGRDDERAERQSIAGALFFITINQSFGGIFSVIFNFPLERSVVTRERASGTYRVSSYWVAKTLTEFPRTLLFVTVFSCIAYWMIGLRPEAGAFFLFILLLFITTIIAESMALAVSILAADPQVSAAINPVFMIIFLLFGGFFIQASQIPVYVKTSHFTTLQMANVDLV